MGNFDALKEMMGAFDNAKQGLVIWDENDNMAASISCMKLCGKKFILSLKLEST